LGPGRFSLLIFWPAVSPGGNTAGRLAVVILIDCGFAVARSQVAGMNELGNVVAGRQANMDGMFRPGGSIVIFEALSQGMGSYADNRIHLRVKGFRAPKSVHGNAVLLDLVNGSFEVLLTNKCQEPNMVVRPSQYARTQNVVYFSPFGLKFANRRLQMDTPKNGPFDLSPRLCVEYNRNFAP
jgi:hypothetical protein